MVGETTDHGNDLMVVQLICFFFLACGIFQESSMEMDVKNCQCYCKKQIESLFSLGISNEPPWASYGYFLDPTIFFLFSQKQIAFVQVYISRQANFTTNLGVVNGTSKNVGIGKCWQDLEISEAFLISLKVSFLHGLFLLFLSQHFLPKSLGLGFLTRISASRRVSDFTICHP